MNRGNLRVQFIGMLFALAVGQLAIEVGDFLLEDHNVFVHLYALTHLLLALTVISSSWIGWQKSKAKGNYLELKKIWSPAYLILLTDVALVICYFILVRGVESTDQDGVLADPSARNEVVLSAVIFFLYLVWDLLTKLVIRDPQFGRLGITAIFLIISIIFCGFFYNVQTRGWVVLADGILIVIFLLYRVTKDAYVEKED